jgi:hypothetical protein
MQHQLAGLDVVTAAEVKKTGREIECGVQKMVVFNLLFYDFCMHLKKVMLLGQSDIKMKAKHETATFLEWD